MPILHSNIFLDESGDLGWTFNKPYRQGGSSRFLTIGYLVCPATDQHIPRRLVKDFYTQYKFDPKTEIKATDLKGHHKEHICTKAVEMLKKYPSFHLGGITVKKENVQKHIRADANKLYNYMINISAMEVVQDHTTCKLTRDNRMIKVASGNSCIDYLQTNMWFERNRELSLTDNPVDSHKEDGVIFIDWITNIIWSKHEDKYAKWCDMLTPHLKEKRLFY